MAHFLSLPPEIRSMIYEYCLVVGKVYPLFSPFSFETYGYDISLPDYKVPDIALLTVSKLINLEAEKILYSRNTFVMPVLKDMEGLFACWLHTPRRNALSWIRSVEVAFHPHDLSKAMREVALEVGCSDQTRKVLSMDRLHHHDLATWAPEVHDALSRALIDDAWYDKARLLTTKLRLHKLTVVLNGSWCLYHCCLLESEVVDLLSMGFVHKLPSHIQIVGLEDMDVEEAMIDRIVESHNHRKRISENAESQRHGFEEDAEE